MTEYNYQKKYPDPIISKIKDSKKENVVYNALPQNLSDTSKSVILEDEFTASTEPVQITEQNLI